MALLDRPRIIGGSTDPAKHAALATERGVLDAIAADSNVDRRMRNGVTLVAHQFDREMARAWIGEALRIIRAWDEARAAEHGVLAPGAANGQALALWQAFANYWASLNVCPYGWRRFRWRCEDLFGHALAYRDRGLDAANPGDVSESEDAAHFRGIQWVRHEEDGTSWFSDRTFCWASSDESGEGGCAAGAWRRSIMYMVGARPAVEGRDNGLGSNVYFGRPQDIGRSVGEIRGGIVGNLADIARPSIGESHRFWLFNNARLFVMPGQSPEDTAPVANLMVPVLDSWGHVTTTMEPFNGVTDGNLRATQVLPVIPPSAWYWDLLAAPVPGLRMAGEHEDLSIVEYLYRTGPGEVVREVLRDVMVRNQKMMGAQMPPIVNESQLFRNAADLDAARAESAQRDGIGEADRMQRTASGIAASTTALATAINPALGAVAGVASLVGILLARALADSTVTSTRYVDVFGRLMPAYEQFAIFDVRAELEAFLERIGYPTGYVPRTGVNVADVAAQIRRGEWFTTQDAARGLDPQGSGAPLRRAGVRTLVLRGLDPVRGARVFVDARDITTTPQERGAAATWQNSDDYGPIWVQGVPEAAVAITVAYPDGARRTIALPALPEDFEGENNISRRTAFVDATQGTPVAPVETEESVGDVSNPNVVDGAQQGYPPRTVVLVGLAAGARIYARGVDVTNAPMLSGDAARWITTTVAAGPATGWSFGVALDDVRTLDIVSPSGERRTVPLPPTTAQTVHDRVTVIDLRLGAPAAPADAYPARTLVLVGMPQGARVLVNGIDVTDTPMLTGDAARWIDSTIPGVVGWAFGVPNDTREVTIVAGATRQTVPLPTMDPALGVRDRVTTIDVRWAFPVEAGVGGMGWFLAAAAAGAGYYVFKGGKR